MTKRRWTLVYHRYIGYGSYTVEFRRVFTTAKALEGTRYSYDLHFVISGWPSIAYPDGQAWDGKGKS